MATEKQLGVYWGNEGLFFVETQETSPTKLFQVPFGSAIKETLKDGPTSIGGMELGSEIHKILRDNDLSDASINLSLPARDIIFRSFVIPPMEDHEIRSVVEFEASKYIPFSLEKLAFSFHPISFLEDNIKRLRIIFVAIKSETLSSYVKILEGASLNINLIEPAPSSLIRALSQKLSSVIPKNQTIALIEKEDVGRITIVDKDVPQFVREFHLTTIGPHHEANGGESPDEVLKKLAGEVRISLDYFNRQNEQLQVQQGILLSSSDLDELSKALGKSLPINIIPIDDQTILGDPSKKELGYLNAYGASVISASKAPVRFNLSRTESRSGSKPRVIIPKQPLNITSIIKTALICVPLIIGSVVASQIAKKNFEKDTETLREKLGRYQDADIATIEDTQNDYQAKLAYFNAIRMDSDAASFLLLIPTLLPEGVWIDTLDVTYNDAATFDSSDKASKKTTFGRNTKDAPSLVVTIDGYAYSENRNHQFRLVNELLRNLKNSEELSSFFTDIDVETTKVKKLEEFPVTSFRILCRKERDNES